MASKLEQLRSMTTVVADTGDIEAVARLKPVDCTTNPTIVLKALGTPVFADRVKEAVTWGKSQNGSSEAVVAAVADRLAISVGAALAELVPGRVSTEVDADLSFDTQASITKARGIIAAYKERGIERERILIKLASTWEGIKAAEVLQTEGIDCNLTLLSPRPRRLPAPMPRPSSFRPSSAASSTGTRNRPARTTPPKPIRASSRCGRSTTTTRRTASARS